MIHLLSVLFLVIFCCIFIYICICVPKMIECNYNYSKLPKFVYLVVLEIRSDEEQKY